jgi:hypothetical protein
MAIKVGGTTVVDDSRNLTNVVNATLSNTLTTTRVTESVVALGNTGTAIDINLFSGTIFTATLNGNCTFTIKNPSTVTSFVLILTNDGTGGRSVAFAGSGATFKVPGGSVTRTSTANAVDFYFFQTVDSGTTWYYNIPMKALA